MQVNDEVGLAGLRVLVTGANGQLGQYLMTALHREGARPIGSGRDPMPGIERTLDVTDHAAVRRVITETRPGAIIHAAAFTAVDMAEQTPELARAVNEDGARHVAEAARDAGIYLTAVSTDFVFAGDGGAPYGEDAPTRPLSVYGQTKLAGELAVQSASPEFAVARTAWLYGGSGKHFPRTVVNVLQARGSIEVVDDEIGSPTFAGDLADALVDLLRARGAGIFHLVNESSCSRYELARTVATLAGFDPAAVKPVSTAEFLTKYPLPAKRPADSRLANVRAAGLGITPRSWSDAIAGYAPTLVNAQ